MSFRIDLKNFDKSNMLYLKILILAILQGMCELLPVSSSAHVIIAERIMGLDPASPDMTLLLVMLHTGTMFAVIVYFWEIWRQQFFASWQVLRQSLKLIVAATVLTGIIGYGLKVAIEKGVLGHIPGAEVEMLFARLDLIALALAAVGLLIIVAGRRAALNAHPTIGLKEATIIGAVQGLCLPFRGFSRSGATISTGLLLNIARAQAEAFSFALAVVLTPPVIAREVIRLLRGQEGTPSDPGQLLTLFLPSMIGMVAAFIAGLLALRWLSSWLEQGRWSFFGYYCLAFAAVVFALYQYGF